MFDKATATESQPARLGALALGALGVVYGDIGTSPLYTIKTAVEWSGGAMTPEETLGMFSLIVWTLIIITSIKYVAVIMRADNEGEGGILALISLLGVKHGRRPFVIAIGMLGAALLFGDGAITPAISVLSAIEGLKTPAPAIAPYVAPISAVVLICLFSFQSQGTARISKFFGPIMTLWFLVIGALGLAGVARHPDVLWGLNPAIGLGYLATHGSAGFLLLGAVFLCATGAEALYADMGHFGRRPIRLAWYGLVLPALLLNYAGQTALLVESPPSASCQPVLRSLSSGVATAARGSCDNRDRDRQPVDHNRSLLDDAPGDPVGTAAAHPYCADIRGELRPDLCRLRQLGANGAHLDPHHFLPFVGTPRRGVRNRRFVDDVADEHSDVHRHA